MARDGLSDLLCKNHFGGIEGYITGTVGRTSARQCLKSTGNESFLIVHKECLYLGLVW